MLELLDRHPQLPHLVQRLHLDRTSAGRQVAGQQVREHHGAGEITRLVVTDRPAALGRTPDDQPFGDQRHQMGGDDRGQPAEHFEGAVVDLHRPPVDPAQRGHDLAARVADRHTDVGGDAQLAARGGVPVGRVVRRVRGARRRPGEQPMAQRVAAVGRDARLDAGPGGRGPHLLEGEGVRGEPTEEDHLHAQQRRGRRHHGVDRRVRGERGGHGGHGGTSLPVGSGLA